ncbi:MAG: methionine synthase, partial [Acidobacteria bacterium]
DIILTNNGYRVINLGIKQPIEEILKAYEEHKADAIGMSGLLVKSTLIMRDNLEIMNERGITVPVILGGAALNRKYVEEELVPLYKGRLFYARDAFDGLHAMDEITGQKSDRAKAQIKSNGRQELLAEEAKIGKKIRHLSSKTKHDTTHTKRSNVSIDVPIPKAPFYGSKVVHVKDLNKVFAFINKTALFKGQWQFKQGRRTTEEYEQFLQKEVYPKFKELKALAIRDKLLEAKLVYGYFPCQSEENDLIIYREDEKTEWLRFTFPRQPVTQRGSQNLCIADFFAPKDSGRIDVVAFHLVTMGQRASEYSAKLFESDNYTEYLLFHGLSVEATEALAEFWHKRIREELGIADEDAEDIEKLFKQGYRGVRFSFGYPACPNLEDQRKIFELLQPERIGVQLTEEFQLNPEQSTSAIIVHHPEARYFNVE